MVDENSGSPQNHRKSEKIGPEKTTGQLATPRIPKVLSPECRVGSLPLVSYPVGGLWASTHERIAARDPVKEETMTGYEMGEMGR